MDVREIGLDVFADPVKAQGASAADLLALQQAMVAVLLQLDMECTTATDRSVERRKKEAFDRAYRTSTVLMSLLKSERELRY